MMARRLRRLASLHEEQIQFVIAGRAQLRERGYVEGPHDLYPELRLAGNVGYTRHRVNVSLLLLLYDQVAVYVPPTTPERLEQKFGVPLSSLVEFAQYGLLVPLLGHLTDYVDPAFDPLLELIPAPASIWARGLGVLEVLGLQETLDEHQSPLPLERIVQISDARAWFGWQFPSLSEEDLTSRIKQELLTNYADLCIFREREIADAIATHRDPKRLISSLFAANEVRTYPSLFGLGGTANFSLASVTSHAALRDSLRERLELRSGVRAIPQSLSLVLEGVSLDVPNMSVGDMVSFHASGDAARLRKAVRRFERHAANRVGVGEKDDIDLFIQRAEELQNLLLEAAWELHDQRRQRAAKTSEHATDHMIRAGGAGLGGWLGSSLEAVLGGLGGAELLRLLIPVRFRERLIDAATAVRFDTRTAPLWRIRQHRSK